MDIAPPSPSDHAVPSAWGQQQQQHQLQNQQQQQQHQQQQQQQNMPMEIQHKLLYVVQRCWHSGPKQYNPVDLLRLFHSQREAEEAAYHSAKAFHNAWVKDSPSKIKSSNASMIGVKTLMLPSYPHHNPQGSSYGFLSFGCLFWVRCLRTTIVTARTQHNNPFLNTWNENSDGVCASEAYAILTESIIGGTGNRNSRRGTEICDGRVFGGDALAYSIAKEAIATVKANLTNFHLQVELKTLPIGKPTEFSYTTGDFLNDWPKEVILERPSSCSLSNNSMNSMMTDNDGNLTTPTNKRAQNAAAADSAAFDSWGRTVSVSMTESSTSTHGNEEEIENVDYVVVDCPFEQPMAKRRRTTSIEGEVATTPTAPMHNGNGNGNNNNSNYGNHLGMTF
ncbi:MAG: hypothetical protein ACI8RD_013562 [Bacillariaceae sp.]|jgi:hypothetical protein